MPKSLRIRTNVGQDTSVNVDLNQEFDFLEILSLKFRESEIYTRMCSDYGVIAGRVSVNRGYGIPNAKISIFIPLSEQDALDPVISELYPYKTLNDVNEQGYKYNLLPKIKSYSNHTPTGSFPTKKEILLNPGWIEVFDKYYKFTVVTNQSGDFMIYGVPLGVQKLIVNIDLSDIGEFSLLPQDLIRMGMATEEQVDGDRFKASNAFTTLPQIVTFNRNIEVLPFWGDPDLCQAAITRTDFDLTDEAAITIIPTSIFIGSMVSTLDKFAIKKFKNNYCKVPQKMGELCKLTAGPGEILAIRHTIATDNNGQPILEQYFLEQNGKVIDENGVWVTELPMNLDFIYTDEFGNQILSTDPSIGIPSKARYRFKIKWQQPETLDDPVRRAYFLVPNVREYGWSSSNNDPLTNSPPSSVQYKDLQKSYTFSLDWNDYVDPVAAINCDDFFYEFYYNKVYTVSQLIDQYRGGSGSRRFNSIKNILEEECESDVNRFPTNDAQFRPDFIYLVFTVFLRVLTPILIALLFIYHVLGFLIVILRPVVVLVYCVIYALIFSVCTLVNWVIGAINSIPGINIDKKDCGPEPGDECNRFLNDYDRLIESLKYVALANLTYPDCEMCNCKIQSNSDAADVDSYYDELVDNYLSTQNQSLLTDWNSADFYNVPTAVLQEPYEVFNNASYEWSETSAVNNMNPNTYSRNRGCNWFWYDLAPKISEDRYNEIPGSLDLTIASVMAGRAPSQDNLLDAFAPVYFGKKYKARQDGRKITRKYFSTSLTMAGKLNLFNTRAKYFNGFVGSLSNPGGPPLFSGPNQGPNQIKVSFNYTANTNTNKFHYDNVMVLSCDPSAITELKPGIIVTFQDFNKSGDVNALSASTENDEGIPCLSGGTSRNLGVNNVIPITVHYADPNSPYYNQKQFYDVVISTADTQFHRWPIDVEYFQVITGLTVSKYLEQIATISISPAGFGLLGGYGQNNTLPYNQNNDKPIELHGGGIGCPTLNPAFVIPPFNIKTAPPAPITSFDIKYSLVSNGNLNNYFYWFRNSFPSRYIYHTMLIREQTDNNIVRPDFWTYPDDPSWFGAEPMWAESFSYYDHYYTYADYQLRNRIPEMWWETQTPILASTRASDQALIFLVRGVDPYSTRNENSYDLSILFGKPYGTGPIVTGKYKLNIPIQGVLDATNYPEVAPITGTGIGYVVNPSTTVDYPYPGWIGGYNQFNPPNYRFRPGLLPGRKWYNPTIETSTTLIPSAGGSFTTSISSNGPYDHTNGNQLINNNANNIRYFPWYDETHGSGLFYKNYNYDPNFQEWTGFTSTLHFYYTDVRLSQPIGATENIITLASGATPGDSPLGRKGSNSGTFDPFYGLVVTQPDPAHAFYGIEPTSNMRGPLGPRDQYGITQSQDVRVITPKPRGIVGNLFTTQFDYHAGQISSIYSTATPFPENDFYTEYVNRGTNPTDVESRRTTYAYDYIFRNINNDFSVYQEEFTYMGNWAGGKLWEAIGRHDNIGGLFSNDTFAKTLVGGEDGDGYWLPRVNGVNYFEYHCNRGYYPFENVDGGEFYASYGVGLGFYDLQVVTPGIQTDPDLGGFDPTVGTAPYFWPTGGNPNWLLVNFNGDEVYMRSIRNYLYNTKWRQPTNNQPDPDHYKWDSSREYGIQHRLFSKRVSGRGSWYVNNNFVANVCPTQEMSFGSANQASLPIPYNKNYYDVFQFGVWKRYEKIVGPQSGIRFRYTNAQYSVFRSDRLPLSTNEFILGTGTTIPFSFALHNNPYFAIYTYSDSAINLLTAPIPTGQNFPAATVDVIDDIPESFNSALPTLNDCTQLLPLGCYYNSNLPSLSGTATYYQTILYDENRPFSYGGAGDNCGACTCTKNRTNTSAFFGKGPFKVFDVGAGCYLVVSNFISSIRLDIKILLEWKLRLDMTFAACRNVFSHMFTNQWVNGVLYAYAFKNDKRYNKNNELLNYEYCKETIIKHDATNNFYYRSSPYSKNTDEFIGKQNIRYNAYRGNVKYLNNPTTIMDLGPKTDYLQELVKNDNFDGYLVGDLKSTTFAPTDDILNFFIFSRLLNANFWEQLFGIGDGGILGLFTRVPRPLGQLPNLSRQKNFVDSDFAQLISINSEIGVDPFEVSNYPFAESMLYNPGATNDDSLIGIFYNSDSQIRDYVSPRRTILNSATTINTFFDPYPNSFVYVQNVKTQRVPFYNWKIKSKGGNPPLPGTFVFGSQQNDWSTDTVFVYEYQKLDRLDVTQFSNYMKDKKVFTRNSSEMRGYIYGSINPAGPQAGLFDPLLSNTRTGPDAPTIQPPAPPNNGNIPYPQGGYDVVTHGAPFFFYFGLINGATAIDKFASKYLRSEEL